MRVALLLMLTLLAIFTIFHVLVLAGVLPYTIVWGGKMQEPADMQRMEVVSLCIMLALLTVVGSRAEIIPLKLPARAYKLIFWAMFLLFLLNTLGNLASVNDFERFAFTPITLAMAICSLRVALD